MTNTNIGAAAREYLEAKAALARANRRADDAQAVLSMRMKEANTPTVIVSDGTIITKIKPVDSAEYFLHTRGLILPAWSDSEEPDANTC